MATVYTNGMVLTNVEIPTHYKYRLSPTHPRDALHHGKAAANKGGRSA